MFAHEEQVESTGNQALLCIHGFYRNADEAQREARQLLHSNPDITACVVDQCHRWLPVCTPTRETAVEEEEVGAPENDAPQAGPDAAVVSIVVSALDAWVPCVTCGGRPSMHTRRM